MPDGGGLINVNLEALSKPATVLIERVSDAVGGIFHPCQIKRVAKAEVAAALIRAEGEIQLSALQQRAAVRLLHEEERKQDNIEKITALAVQELQAEAKPEELEADWLAHFFDRCKLVSDGEMQTLWARLLAGQANKPKSFSRRTVTLVSEMGKMDAQLFTTLCGFGWMIGDVVPLVYDTDHEVYTEAGIHFNALTHLDSVGLITFNSITGFIRRKLPKRCRVYYYGEPVVFELASERDNTLQMGYVLLTVAGQELAPICGSKPVEKFRPYVRTIWEQHGYKIISGLEAPVAVEGRPPIDENGTARG